MDSFKRILRRLIHKVKYLDDSDYCRARTFEEMVRNYIISVSIIIIILFILFVMIL